jgi:ATP-dependent Clp protease ATP-binding subunit ClpA
MKKHLGLPIYYRINKFVHFQNFNDTAIYAIVNKAIDKHIVESANKIRKDDLYNRVSRKLISTGENARTISNVVQQEVENLLLEEIDP